MTIRAAEDADAEPIARVVNLAYEVEHFFVAGDRTNVGEIRALMRTGMFFVACDEAGAIVGTVFTETTGARGYFGMLAVAPLAQGRGIAHRLIDLVESRARESGCETMAITVVDLRTDLFEFYARLGYVETGRAPYVNRPVIVPCEFICLDKRL